jgi:CrcB protein
MPQSLFVQLSWLFIIGVAGGLGTLARYGVNIGTAALFGNAFPWGTFIVNIVGSFLFGIGAGLFSQNYLSPEWKVVLLTGLLGGFTTFSAFTFDNQQFINNHRFAVLTLNLFGQNILGVAAVLIGLAAAGAIGNTR